jgi:Skp family chaperone for outer membrane proteins
MKGLATIAGLACSAALAVTAAAGEGPAAPPRVAIVDVEKVLTDYKKSGDIYKDIEKELEPLANALKQKARYLREEQQRVASDPRADKLDLLKRKHKIEMDMAEVERDEREFNERRAELEVKALEDVYGDMIAAVAKYSKENGLDLVIKQQVSTSRTRSTTTVRMRIAAQTVLYAAPQLDITEAILKQMNTDYERNRTAPPRETPAKG